MEEFMNGIGQPIVQLVIIAIIGSFIGMIPLKMYENKRKVERARRAGQGDLVRVPDLPLTTVMEKLRETIPFPNSQILEIKGSILVTCIIPGVRKKIAVGIRQRDEYFEVSPVDSDALSNNVSDRIEDALSMACWNEHYHLDINAAYEFERMNRWKKLMKGIRIAACAVLIGCVCVIAYQDTMAENYVNGVRDAVLTDTTDSIGTVFDEFFGDSKWSNIKATNDQYTFVRMDGKCYYVAEAFQDSKREVNAEVDFLINKDSGELNIHSVKIDGAQLDGSSMEGFIEDVYVDHMAVHNYDSFGSILEDFGSVFGNAISDSLYGHYVSYYSDSVSDGSSNKAEDTAPETSEVPESTIPETTAPEWTAAETETPEASRESLQTAKISDYNGSFDIETICNTEWSCRPDDMTNAVMTITVNDDGSLHLAIQASSTHNPYVNNFSGNSVMITGAQNADLYILFETDDQDPDGVGDRVEVTWSSMEAIDFPNVKGGDENGSFIDTYLYDGQYNFEKDV